MPQSFGALYFHLIFSTKHRAPLLVPDWRPRLHEYIGGILRTMDGALLSAGGMPDHAHLLISLSREAAIADTLREIKSRSCGWIHDTFADRQDFAWQTGYAAFSVSHSERERVRKYLAGQAEHHRVRSFQEEYIEFLKAHELPYDERYVFD